MLTARTTTGMGVEMDIAKALDLYSQSGKQGHASALIRLGYLYQFGMAEPGTDTHPD
jgi:TPR repeat protein